MKWDEYCRKYGILSYHRIREIVAHEKEPIGERTAVIGEVIV